MTRYSLIIVLTAAALYGLTSCRNNGMNYDASGTFESREIIVSSEANGKILSFPVREGDVVAVGQLLARIDSTTLVLQMEQARSSLKALDQKQNSPQPQITVLNQQLAVAESQLKTLGEQLRIMEKEQARVRSLFAGEAATAQQMDDINGKVDILKSQLATASEQKAVILSQIKAARDQVSIQNRGIISEREPMEKRLDQVRDQIARTYIKAPQEGTVLTKYAEEGEFTAVGKPLLKLADMEEMVLRAYITGDQLGRIKTGDQVDIFVDQGKDDFKAYKGKVTWISDKAEFTPKTIQTRDERANLVYAVKVSVKNDGLIRLGMYGELAFVQNTAEK